MLWNEAADANVRDDKDHAEAFDAAPPPHPQSTTQQENRILRQLDAGIRRLMQNHPTVAEFIPTILGDLAPLPDPSGERAAA